MVRATLTVAEAAELLGIGRTLAYELARSGAFPVPVVRLGRRLVVPVGPLATLLGLAPEEIAQRVASREREEPVEENGR